MPEDGKARSGNSSRRKCGTSRSMPAIKDMCLVLGTSNGEFSSGFGAYVNVGIGRGLRRRL